MSVLLVGLLVTALVVQDAKMQFDRSARREFDFVCSEIQDKIVDRLKAHEQILRSGAAFFAAANDITRQDWRRFTTQLNLEQDLPGIQGVGFELLIPRARLAQHIQEVRAEGFPGYRVWPEGERDVYSAVIYLEPFTNRNCRVLGYDGLSEPVRRAALERARDDGVAALSGKIELVQETGQDIQAGTLMYVPVYHQGMPTGTVDQRRAALRGWVYSPYRMTDLLRGILGQADLVDTYRIHLKIFDGTQASAAALLYDSQSGANQPSGRTARLSLQQTVVLAGCHWTLHYTAIDSPAGDGIVWFVLLGGTSLTLLLAGFVFNLLNTRSKAEQIAQLLTQELRVSAEHQRTILQTAMDGFWVTDMQGQILEANAAYCQMSGYRPPELLALRVTDLEVGYAASDIAARIQQVVAQGAARFESRHRRKDGSEFDVEISIQYQPTGGGRLVAFLRDITVRKQAQVQLLEATEQAQQKTAFLRSIMESPKGVIIFALDRHYRYTEFTPLHQTTIRNIWGREIELGLNILEVISDPADREKAKANFDRTLAGEHLLIVEEYGDSAHERRSYENRYSPVFDRGGAIVGLTVFVIDISDRKRAEAELQEKEENYRTLADSGMALIWTAGLDKKCDYFNQPWLKFTGRTLAQELGDGWAEGVHPDDLARCFKIYTEAFDRRESFSMDYRLRRHDGEFRWIQDVGTPRHDRRGNFLGYIGHCLDISDNKQALTELQQAQQQLIEQERLRVVGQLAAGIAHDFNNTLAPIVGFSELLLKDPAKRADPALLVQWLQYINTAATDAASVVRQIRELSHAPAPDALRVPVDLNQLIQQIIASTQPRWKDQAQGEGRTLNIVAQCGLIPPVTGEEYALREAITNLLFNAVDFTPNGGTITLGTAVAGEFVQCWVSDTGSGMTEETRQHCLEPFFTTKGPQGTGLGLAMVQSIVQRYGGTVAIASVLGQGTTVTLRLPIPTVLTAVPTRVVLPPVPRVLRVLVVDDEPLLCVLVEAWLKIDGHSVATVSCGAAALQRLQTDPVDLVITDKAMPQMSGEQLAVAIQAVAPALPVILMTGFGDLLKASGELPPHIRAILSKPITEASLREAMGTVFPEN